MKVKLYIKNWFLRKATSYIRNYSKNSNYIKYAIKEFDIAYGNWKNNRIQSIMCNDILDILALLYIQGDSGFTIRYKTELLKKLMKFDVISPLTFKEEEWGKAYIQNGEEVKQNNRNSSYFLKPNGDITYNYATCKQVIYYIGKDKEIIEGKRDRYNGRISVLDKDGKIYSLIVKLKKPYTYPNPTIEVPTYEIEYPSEWFLTLSKIDVIEKIKEHYDVDLIEDKDYFKNEVENFKDGKYKDELLDVIRIVKEHMYGKE